MKRTHVGQWILRHGVVDWSVEPVIMGVLNLTPDSFSDGGLYVDPGNALRRVDEMVAEGVGLIDLGPESTRPGSDPVPDAVQIDRLRPVLEGIRKNHPRLPVSVDTRSAAVAATAIELGADIINDVSALRDDPDMVAVARDTNTPVVLMHMRGRPKTMQDDPSTLRYEDVVQDVICFLRERVAFAERSGIPREHIAIDPGIGFGKTTADNLRLINGLGSLTALGPPVVLGASRKRFIGRILDRDQAYQRIAGSLACAALAVSAGVRIIRTHDVRETRDVVRMASAIRDAT